MHKFRDIPRLYSEGRPFAFYRFPNDAQIRTGGDFTVHEWGNTAPEPWTVSTPHAEYIEGTRQIVERLRRDGGKTVRMRTICGRGEVDMAAVAADVFELFPDAFCFCFFSPVTGLWVGATPELLLEASDGKVQTMALAGTRPVGTPGAWDAKNVAEQTTVTDFIISTLKHHCSDVQSEAPTTLPYGCMEHICTRISGTLAPGYTAEELLAELSPTPAVCGFPRAAALTDIASVEDAPRRCYAGYMLAKDTDGCLRAYVTLRCAQISPEGWCIYAGGGITADSDPESEWRETQLKASSLLKIIQSNCNTNISL